MQEDHQVHGGSRVGAHRQRQGALRAPLPPRLRVAVFRLLRRLPPVADPLHARRAAAPLHDGQLRRGGRGEELPAELRRPRRAVGQLRRRGKRRVVRHGVDAQPAPARGGAGAAPRRPPRRRPRRAPRVRHRHVPPDGDPAAVRHRDPGDAQLGSTGVPALSAHGDRRRVQRPRHVPRRGEGVRRVRHRRARAARAGGVPCLH
mmetsp:Transcript_8189/g.25560  ORF Transcript_8189/g.25560 Transcript_8189/m.25560 type:complete len:203 (-) Transcript_8189:1128-1736(-)